MARSDSSPPCMPGVRLSPFPAGLPVLLAANDEVSFLDNDVLVHVVSQRAWGLRLRGISARTREFSALAGVAFPFCPQGRHPVLSFSKLDTQPTDTFVYASTAASRRPPQNSRPGGSLLLSCRTLAFPTTCRFIPARGQPDLPPFHKLETEHERSVPFSNLAGRPGFLHARPNRCSISARKSWSPNGLPA